MQTCYKCKQTKSLDNFHLRTPNEYFKQCKACRKVIVKQHYESNKDKYREYKSKYNKNNRDKCNQLNRRWRKENPDANYRIARTYALKKYALKKYGVTLETYKQLFEEQRGLCKICNKPERSIDTRYNTIRSLSVDHCHITDKVRGLLCGNCNRGLGNFTDSIELLEKARLYLINTHSS